MSSRLIIDGNTVYEIDEDCVRDEEKLTVNRMIESAEMKSKEEVRKK